MEKGLAAIMCIMGMFTSGCRQQDLPIKTAQVESTSKVKTEDDAALLNDVKTFTADVGQDGEKAWARLQSIPRDKLIRRLIAMRSAIPADDSMQPRIAFVLGILDYEYRSNARIVASSLSREARYRNFYGDDAAALIVRLIDRGDKTLLPILLGSADWADGALAEQLNDTITDRLVRDTDTLLEALRVQPRKTRAKIYRLIRGDAAFSAEDKERVRKRLRGINTKANSYPNAQELLASVLD
jgi:hypothetical protein